MVRGEMGNIETVVAVAWTSSTSDDLRVVNKENPRRSAGEVATETPRMHVERRTR
jgi:hypothetical protein